MIMSNLKKMCVFFSMFVAVGLVGCGSTSNASSSATANAAEAAPKGKALVVYYSVPEATSATNRSQEGRNSSVVIDGKLMGNTEYVASLIAKTVGADEFRIDTVQKYPLNNHSAFISQAREEKQRNYRPELTGKPANLSQYDVIFLGYPNWWGDMPMALYAFLEQNDLSGKTIIPFNTHGGSGLSGSVSTIAEKAPKATVVRDAYSVYRSDVAECAPDVRAWLKKLGY